MDERFLYVSLTLAFFTAAVAVAGLIWRRQMAIRILSAVAAMYLAIIVVWMPALWGMDAGWFPAEPNLGVGLGVMALILVAWVAISYGLSRVGAWLSSGGGAQRRAAFMAYAAVVTCLAAGVAAILTALALTV